MRLSRRDFLKYTLRTFGALTAVTVGGAFWATRVEPFFIATEWFEIPLRRLPPAFDGTTLVHISDPHFGAWMTGPRFIRLAHQINALQPDIIAITGDFVSYIDRRIADDMIAALRALETREGVYGVYGNHDYWADLGAVGEAVRAAGVRLMINQHTVIERGGERLYIAGVDDIWENRQDLDAALDGIPLDACIILLAHEPDYANEVVVDGRVDLQLSGHSHGGQVQLPLIGAPVLPHLAKDYYEGLYDVDGLKLYVNRGVGMLDIAFRFLCSREITHITLRRA